MRVLLTILLLAAPALAHHGENPPPAPPPRIPRLDPQPKVGSPGTPEVRGVATPPESKLSKAQRWTTWWYRNRDLLLGITERRLAAQEAWRARFTGQKLEEARSKILTVLRRAASSRDKHIATSALIAIGKSGDATQVSFLLPHTAGKFGRHHARAEAALLAVGMVGRGNPAALAHLKGVLADKERFWRDRAHAAAALGLLGEVGALPALIGQAAKPEAHLDIPALSLLSLGLLGEEMVVPDLARAVQKTGSTGRARRVLAAAALGKLESRQGLAPLVAALADEDKEMQRQAALSLGTVATKDDADAVAGLMKLLSEDRDPLIKSFAGISLGEMGVPGAEKTLSVILLRNHPTAAPFAALALGLFSRNSGNEKRREEIGAAFATLIESPISFNLKGAVVIALGIMEYRAAVPALRGLLSDKHPPEIRRHAATALGLIGDPIARDDLRAILPKPGDFRLRNEAALALALLGDLDAAGILEKILRGDHPDHLRSGAALAMAFITTPERARVLIELLEDEGEKSNLRNMATLALGVVVDRSPLPALSRFGDHLNTNFSIEVLDDILAIF